MHAYSEFYPMIETYFIFPDARFLRGPVSMYNVLSGWVPHFAIDSKPRQGRCSHRIVLDNG